MKKIIFMSSYTFRSIIFKRGLYFCNIRQTVTTWLLMNKSFISAGDHPQRYRLNGVTFTVRPLMRILMSWWNMYINKAWLLFKSHISYIVHEYNCTKQYICTSKYNWYEIILLKFMFIMSAIDIDKLLNLFNWNYLQV